MKKILLATPTMHEEEQQYVREAFETNWIAPLGPNVDAFEHEVAAYAGAPGAAALSSGTAALHLAVILAGVKEHDTVFVPSLTFAASVNPVRYEKAVPVFIDSERNTWNMNPKALQKAFEKYPHPAAVMAVHLYGTSADMDEICRICQEHQVPLIEDAAESLGTTYRGRMTGTFGDYGIYSFNGNKIITTSGGGILVAKKEEEVERARFLSRQARDPARHYQHSVIGYNYRMSNVVAGIGRGQMLHIREHIGKKHKIYCRYKEAFADIAEIEDVRNRFSDLGVLYLGRANEQVLKKVFEEQDLDFHELFTARPHVFLRRGHPLADRERIRLSDLKPYPRLNFVQGAYESSNFAEELFSHEAADKNIRISDRAAIVNFMIGLDGYTISSGIFPRYLQGDSIVSIPLEGEDVMRIGYLLNKDRGLSELGQIYVEALRQYQKD